MGLPPLEGHTLDDEAYLNLVNETGLVDKEVDRLLTLQRVKEARAATQQASDYEMLQLADIFKAHGQIELAQRLMQERAQTSTDSRVNDWLKRHALDQGDPRRALELAETIFWQHPSERQYEDIKSIAQQVGNWPDIYLLVQKSSVPHFKEQKWDRTFPEDYTTAHSSASYARDAVCPADQYTSDRQRY